MKTLITILFARLVRKRNNKWITNPLKFQAETFNKLLKKANNTEFGKDHNFSSIKNYKDFQNQVPIRDYEGLKPYVDRVVAGEKNILWPGQPLYFAKTSGTTSGAKYIPITKESIRTHINSARDALLNYFLKTKNYSPINGKHMFLQGSPTLEKKNGVYFQVVEALKGFDWVEFGGIEPNPKYETLLKAIKLAKKEQINFVA